MSNIRYQAPPGTLVHWGDLQGRPGLKSPTVINTKVQWDGSTMSPSYLERYAEGDRSAERKGSYIVSFGGEAHGGVARDQVKVWKVAHGSDEEPNWQEILDWTLQWGNSGPPLEGPNGDRHNPIPVKDPRYVHGALRNIDGLYYTNDLSPKSKAKRPFPDGPVVDHPKPPTDTPPVVVTPPEPPTEPETPTVDALALVQQLRVDVNRLFREAERKAKAKK